MAEIAWLEVDASTVAIGGPARLHDASAVVIEPHSRQDKHKQPHQYFPVSHQRYSSVSVDSDLSHGETLVSNNTFKNSPPKILQYGYVPSFPREQ